ncbi:hypothetical protein [Marinicrinis sediminis]|uniref:Uncharacterized protein n=1 Tax=Marinicrinis sediminis TaxID=1652465 RepID=A0ABW5RBH2_9BACL
MKRLGKGWPISAAVITFGMLLFMLPRLEMGQGWSMASIFGVVWLGFALLVLSAHLYRLLGVDEEKERQLARIRRMKQWKQEKWLEEKVERLSRKAKSN